VTTSAEFYHQMKKCYKFGKIDPRKKRVEIQTIVSCMSLAYNRVPNNLYFPYDI
jgi:hypothetical protein